jgi:hypothetical protein
MAVTAKYMADMNVVRAACSASASVPVSTTFSPYDTAAFALLRDRLEAI